MTNTEIVGNPAELRTIATWLRRDLAGGLGEARSSLRYVREDGGGWTGSAGDSFRARMGEVAMPTTETYDATLTGARGIERFAGSLDSAKGGIETVRAAATAAGLTVTSAAILAPPASPAPPIAPCATAGEMQSQGSAVTAYDAGIERWHAYEIAAADVATIRADLATAAADLASTQAAVALVIVPTVDVLLSTVIDSTAAATVGALTGQSQHLRDLASSFEENTRLPGSAVNPDLYYRDLDDATRLRGQAAATSDDAVKALRVGKVLGASVAVVLTGVSIYSDIQAGESVAQASTSNLAGLGAAVAAGAVIGSFIPVPIVGTAVGALGGAVVGIFTSGMVDSVFEKGPDVGAAFTNGWQDLAGTGAAIGDLAVAGAGGVGNAFDWASDGLSNEWGSVFG